MGENGENAKVEMKRVIQSQEMLDAVLREIDFASKKETKLSSVYCLMEFDGHIEPLYFAQYEDVFLESECWLMETGVREEELEDFVRDTYVPESFDEALQYEKMMVRDGIHYEIINPQNEPFLSFPCTLLGVISETECLDWLLQNRGEN
ncbi:MAG: hypothetical protein IJ794_05025 [Lachnospiraceae bacterium]|nr:hypothetical protein [Lachnospiraceae bacterium]MBR1852502.1 hypothetical protein [Lachnospiraceae bacterium]